ncbi:unnamed protein product [Knipowitschia caucasica]
MLLDTHSPTLHPYEPREKRAFVRNRVFVRSTAWSGWLAFAQLLSRVHEEDHRRCKHRLYERLQKAQGTQRFPKYNCTNPLNTSWNMTIYMF